MREGALGSRPMAETFVGAGSQKTPLRSVPERGRRFTYSGCGPEQVSRNGRLQTRVNCSEQPKLRLALSFWLSASQAESMATSPCRPASLTAPETF